MFVPQRATERDARKAKIKEKKLHAEREALLAAIKVQHVPQGSYRVMGNLESHGI